MEWNNETTLEFLRQYKREPILWDTSNADYKDKRKTYEAWNRIGVVMDLDVFELKKKKESVMATFRGHVRKKRCLERSKLLREGETYRPSWFAYEFMEGFLGPMYQTERYVEEEEAAARAAAYIKKRKIVGGDPDAVNEESAFIDENSSSVNNEESSGHVLDDADLVDHAVEKRDPLWMEPSSPIHNNCTSSTRPSDGFGRRVLHHNERTEFDVFGTSVAAQLNSMPWEDAVELQLQVQQLMTQYRLSVHRRKKAGGNSSGSGGGGGNGNVVLLPSSTCNNREITSFKEEDFSVSY